MLIPFCKAFIANNMSPLFLPRPVLSFLMHFEHAPRRIFGTIITCYSICPMALFRHCKNSRIICGNVALLCQHTTFTAFTVPIVFRTKFIQGMCFTATTNRKFFSRWLSLAFQSTRKHWRILAGRSTAIAYCNFLIQPQVCTTMTVRLIVCDISYARCRVLKNKTEVTDLK